MKAASMKALALYYTELFLWVEWKYGGKKTNKPDISPLFCGVMLTSAVLAIGSPGSQNR
jgi:hypothetical protein